MLNQDFEADQKQDDAAGTLGPGFVARAKYGTDLHANYGNQEGDASDKCDRRKNAYFQECEGNADCQRIDAGRDGEKQHGLYVHGRITGFRLLFQGFFDHVKADDAKQNEGDPVVVGFDGTLEADAKQVAEPRHECLKTAEIQPDDQRVFGTHGLHGKSFADRHRKGIHGQAQGKKKEFNQGHGKTSLYFYYYMCSGSGLNKTFKYADHNSYDVYVEQKNGFLYTQSSLESIQRNSRRK